PARREHGGDQGPRGRGRDRERCHRAGHGRPGRSDQGGGLDRGGGRRTWRGEGRRRPRRGQGDPRDGRARAHGDHQGRGVVPRGRRTVREDVDRIPPGRRRNGGGGRAAPARGRSNAGGQGV